MNSLRSAYVRLLRFGFRLLYNEMAWTYDLVSAVVSLGEWRAWGRAALKHTNIPIGRTGARILELAHGTGNLQKDLTGLGYWTVGYDLSRTMGRITRRKFAGARRPPRLVNGRAQQLPFAAEAFDAIVCTFPTNFIMDQLTIEEAYRVLKPGARLVFVPGSVFIRRGAAETTLEALYRVTGQRGADKTDWSSEYRSAYEAQGFKLSEALEPCKRSAAIVIIAEKPV